MRKISLLLFVAMFFIPLAGCANRLAGENAARGMREFEKYARNADAQVAYSERQLLEYKIKELTKKIQLGHESGANPEDINKKVENGIWNVIEEYESRGQRYRSAQAPFRSSVIAYWGSVIDYHKRGVTSGDVIPLIEDIGNNADIIGGFIGNRGSVGNIEPSLPELP